MLRGGKQTCPRRPELVWITHDRWRSHIYIHGPKPLNALINQKLVGFEINSLTDRPGERRCGEFLELEGVMHAALFSVLKRTRAEQRTESTSALRSIFLLTRRPLKDSVTV